jgi:hypothetical protein
MKFNYIFIFFFTGILFSCHEKIDERAAREAKEYTNKFCPTPFTNYTRTDSVVFDKATYTYHFYCTFTDKMDNEKLLLKNRKVIYNGLLASIAEDTNMKAYKDAGFYFRYTCHSHKNPKQILFDVTYSPKQYNTLSLQRK